MADKRQLVANAAAAALLLALVAGVLAWQRPWASTDDPATSATVPAGARALLAQQFQRLSDAQTREAFVAAGGDSESGRTTAADIWDARRTLDVEDVAFAYRRGGQAPDRADGTTSALVEVSWRGGSADVRFRLLPGAEGFGLVSASKVGRDALPVWLAGRVEVERMPGTTVVTIDGGDDDIDAAALARRAAAISSMLRTSSGFSLPKRLK